LARGLLYDTVAVTSVIAIVVGGAYYALEADNYVLTTLIVSVLVPLVVGTLVLYSTGERILVFAFLAYIWAVIDDAPVFFDSVLTWPEVTQFHPFLPRLLMNVLIHALTALFVYLTLREAVGGVRVRLADAVWPIAFACIAFVLAYAQNIPLSVIQDAVLSSWYPFDVGEKVASIAFFILAVRKAQMISRTWSNQG
jgi:hypothetical protein